MLHKNTVFHGLLKDVQWPAFDRLVEHHRADAGVRRLPTKSQKVHVIYDPDADRPIYAIVTAGNVNDITAAQAMPIEPGATPALPSARSTVCSTPNRQQFSTSLKWCSNGAPFEPDSRGPSPGMTVI